MHDIKLKNGLFLVPNSQAHQTRHSAPTKGLRSGVGDAKSKLAIVWRLTATLRPRKVKTRSVAAVTQALPTKAFTGSCVLVAMHLQRRYTDDLTDMACSFAKVKKAGRQIPKL